MSPTYLCWIVLGSPKHIECADTPGARCWVCAGPAERSMPRADWLGSSYTGQNRVKLPSSNAVCEPCVWLHSRNTPVPGRPPKEGKTAGGNWRNYTVMVELVGNVPQLVTASKGEKDVIRAWLRRPKQGRWFAAIADSGQKHVVPSAPLNAPGGRRVLFEEQEVLLPDGEGWQLVEEMSALLTRDVSKEAIGPGEYTMQQYSHSAAEIAVFEERRGGERGSPWWALALWLSQRDEAALQEIQAERKRNASKPKSPAKRGPAQRNDQPAVGGAPSVPSDGGQRPGPLAADPEPDAPRREEQHHGGGVVQHPEPRPAPAQRGQLSLFGA